MPMTPEERGELMEKVMEEPLPPMQELIGKWIKPAPVVDEWLDEDLPEGIRNEGPADVIGPDLIPDEDAIASEEKWEPPVEVVLEPEVKEAVRQRILDRSVESLQARVAAAAAALDRRDGEG